MAFASLAYSACASHLDEDVGIFGCQGMGYYLIFALEVSAAVGLWDSSF